MTPDPPIVLAEAPAERLGTPDVARRLEAIVAAPEQMETVAAALRALAPLVAVSPAGSRPPTTA